MFISKKRWNNSQKEIEDVKGKLAELKRGLQILCKHKECEYLYKPTSESPMVAGLGFCFTVDVPNQYPYSKKCVACGYTETITEKEYNAYQTSQEVKSIKAQAESRGYTLKKLPKAGK